MYQKKKLFRNNYIQNVNINVEWMWFPNLLAWNNPKWVWHTTKIRQSILLFTKVLVLLATNEKGFSV